MVNRRIVLTGYRGTGKSSTGAVLSALTGLPHYETDSLIEKKAGRKIPELFRDEGEEAFRILESDIIRDLPGGPCIISTGGGAVTYPDNIRMLRRDSIVILLTASIDTIHKRISGSDRPALTSKNARDEIEHLLSKRRSAYQSSADYVVKTDGCTAEQTAEHIMDLLLPSPYVRENRGRLLNFVKSTNIPPIERSFLEMGIDSDIRLYGILGYPCMHSKSPKVWNYLFHHYRMPAHYTWFECNEPQRFINEVRRAGVRGLSVTIPHKEAVIPCLDEVCNDAELIGKVNTILFQGDEAFGYNTDWKGIYKPLEGSTGETAVIIGAGGGAASAVYASQMRGYTPYILNRTVKRAEDLAKQMGAEYGPISDIDRLNPDLIINATSVGMGDDSHLPIPASVLKAGMRVFDLVYTPIDTPLLKTALAHGCYVIPGTEMFIHQLIEQFKILTGIDVSVSQIRELVM